MFGEQDKLVVVVSSSNSVNNAQSSTTTTTTTPILYSSSSSSPSNTTQNTTNNLNYNASFTLPQTVNINAITPNTTTQSTNPISTTVVQPPPLVFTPSTLPTVVNKPLIQPPPPTNLPNPSLKRKAEEIATVKTEDSTKKTTPTKDNAQPTHLPTQQNLKPPNSNSISIQPKPVRSERYQALHPDYITPFASKEDAYQRLIVFQSLTTLNPPEIPNEAIAKGTADIVLKLETLEKKIRELNEKSHDNPYKEDLLLLEKLAVQEEKAELENLKAKWYQQTTQIATLPITTNTTTSTSTNINTTSTPNINLLQVRLQPPLNPAQIPRTIATPIQTITPIIRPNAPSTTPLPLPSNTLISPSFTIITNTSANTSSNINTSTFNGTLGNSTSNTTPFVKNINAPPNSNNSNNNNNNGTINNSHVVVNNSSSTSTPVTDK